MAQAPKLISETFQAVRPSERYCTNRVSLWFVDDYSMFPVQSLAAGGDGMLDRIVVKGLVVTVLLTCSALAFPVLAGDSNDKLTTLPLHSGLAFQQEVDSPICGKKAQNQYL